MSKIKETVAMKTQAYPGASFVSGLYEEKKSTYFDSVRVEVLKLVRGRDNRILDLGCGSGKTGSVLLSSGKARKVFGVELIAARAEEAKTHLDQVIVGNIEHLDLPFPKRYFDYVIAADVLEHLFDPWSTLKTVTQFLKDDGHLIVSIPNIQNWRILRDLIFRGDWRYVEQGLLDRTHLRFFTRKTLIELLHQAGYRTIEVFPGFSLHPRGFKARWINYATLGSFRNFLTHQYIALGSLK